jgi:hypothetical protein
MSLLVDVHLGDHYAVSHSPRLPSRLPSARQAGSGRRRVLHRPLHSPGRSVGHCRTVVQGLYARASLSRRRRLRDRFVALRTPTGPLLAGRSSAARDRRRCARSPHRQRVKRPDSRRDGHRRDGHRRDKQTDSAIRRSRPLALAPSVPALAGKR